MRMTAMTMPQPCYSVFGPGFGSGGTGSVGMSGGGGGGDIDIDNSLTRDGIQAMTVSPSTGALRTSGFSDPGDGGGALYKRVAVEPAHAGKVQSADGAWWELVPEAGVAYLRQFGAKGNGLIDDAPAVQAAIDYVGLNFNNGKIFCSAGDYLLNSAIILEHNILFEGEGQSTLTNGRSTVFLAAAGVTAFSLRFSSIGNGANSQFRNIEIEALGRNATTTTGTMAAGSKTLTLAASADFADGDIILVRGAGHRHRMQQEDYNFASATAGSPVVTLTQDAGFFPGMVVDVTDAGFPAGTYVVSKLGLDLTLSANAASTVSNKKIYYYNDLVAQVFGGGGTTTLTLNEAATNAAPNAEVMHYDCGIYTQTFTLFDSVTVRGFQGAGIFFHAGSGQVDNIYGAATNSNLWRISNSVMRDNRNGVRLRGRDANAGTAISLDVDRNDEFGLVDASLLGNYYFGLHVSGGFGYMTVLDNQSSVFSACYTEGGTHNSFAAGTVVIGGVMGGSAGNLAGGSAIQQAQNAIYQSPTVFGPHWHDTRLTMGSAINPVSGNLMTIDAGGIGGSPFIRFQRTLITNGQAGLWGWMVGGSPAGAALLFSDEDAEKGKGHAYMLRGAYIGRDQGTVTQGNFRRWFGGASVAPVSGSFTQGDAFINHSMFVGQSPFFVCVGSGSPGAWRGLTQIPTIDGAVTMRKLTDAELAGFVASQHEATVIWNTDRDALMRSDGAAWRDVRVAKVAADAGTARTLSAPDAQRYVRMTANTPNTVTVDAGVFTADDEITIRQAGLGQTTIVAGAGVTVHVPYLGTMKLAGQGATVTLKAISASEFDLIGQVEAVA